MPFLNIQLMKGRTIEQKRQLVSSVTKAVCESVDVAPEKVRVVLSEMEAEDCAIAGVLVIDQV
ncbi:MAG: 2-hydroxymuconate tautomerase family protein [Rickettsiaceae bacterium]|nr:2-hydroxymuconate tautomerase family protein [Rickettsiaceae bacterium]MDP5020836.1 2-hydroxymuconate tautomerase family protein [Rickettsiaceae bacterium]MDP5083366.1 2-hydroxymuconate tautomerase family protein [Rickettsiaceae bacterium]